MVVGYSEKDDKNEDIFQVVEDMPQFIGEDGNVMKFLAKRIRYPLEAQKKNITGKVFVTFVINTCFTVVAKLETGDAERKSCQCRIYCSN